MPRNITDILNSIKTMHEGGAMGARPSPESKKLLAQIHSANVKRADDMDKEAGLLMQAAKKESDPEAKKAMMRVAKSMRKQAQVGPRQAQYDARTVYDSGY